MTVVVQEAICDVRIDCDGWAEIEPGPLAEMCFRAVRQRCADVKSPVSILFTDDAVMASLNSAFRGVDRPTNVLSFPPGDVILPDHDYLGDIALGLEISRAEAAGRNVSLRDHAAHLLVHGMLHLIGYDHEEEADAATMEAQESTILARLGVPDPYAVAANE